MPQVRTIASICATFERVRDLLRDQPPFSAASGGDATVGRVEPRHHPHAQQGAVMHGRPVTQSASSSAPSHPNRWRILGVLVLALLVTSIDHTIINVAMPQLVEGLNASSADLQ